MAENTCESENAPLHVAMRTVGFEYQSGISAADLSVQSLLVLLDVC